MVFTGCELFNHKLSLEQMDEVDEFRNYLASLIVVLLFVIIIAADWRLHSLLEDRLDDIHDDVRLLFTEWRPLGHNNNSTEVENEGTCIGPVDNASNRV